MRLRGVVEVDVRGKISGYLLLAALLFLAAGCGGTADSERPDDAARADKSVASRASIAATTDTRVIVTRASSAMPEGCRPRPVAEVVIRFVDAFNRGDQAGLSRVFFISEGPSPPDFSTAGYYPWSWYSSREVGAGGRVADHFTTTEQGELLRYFAERHGQGERMRLLKVSLTHQGVLDETHNVGFIFVLTRKARDLGPGFGGPAGIVYGKGALNCVNGKIFTWNMDMKIGEKRSAREAATWLCEDPPGWKPGKGVVACT
jgi:hypothetical protein